MTRNFLKYSVLAVMMLLGFLSPFHASTVHALPATNIANTVNIDQTSVAVQDVRLFIVKPYYPQFEKQIKIEVTNIEDEDEDELGQDDKQNPGKNYVELVQFLNNSPGLDFLPQKKSFSFSRTFSPLSAKSLNIAFCVFRI
ncbi:MAG: hypothetical protein JNL60_02515 [Bacteroidia bacterium]|nr:hypothetical protein [Bacteroidia bacterium]